MSINRKGNIKSYHSKKRIRLTGTITYLNASFIYDFIFNLCLNSLILRKLINIMNFDKDAFPAMPCHDVRVNHCIRRIFRVEEINLICPLS